jgi:hypothetical protein
MCVTFITGKQYFPMHFYRMNSHMQQHWDTIYRTKQPHEVSWTQEVPVTSLAFLHQLNTPKDARIIDIGGGDSTLVDHLLEEGYTDITVLDISGAAIERAKKRLGARSERVKWIVGNILDFHAGQKYDLWHDRAAFHFQTTPEQIEAYLKVAQDSVCGHIIVATFSTDGPKKCSGLEIKQYDENTLTRSFRQGGFEKIDCKREDHLTPSGSVQNFIFCSFRRN